MKISPSYQKILKKKAKAKKRSKKRRALKRKIKRQSNILQDCVTFHFSTAMSGNSYWKNYANVFNWQKNYNNFIYYNCFPNSFTQRNKYFKRNYIVEEPKISSGHVNKYVSNDAPAYNSNDDCDVESEDEYVVTEEMMKFLEISMRHKQEREANKKKELLKVQNLKDKKDIPDRDKVEECQIPKEKSVDAIRMQEMNDLYGNSAAMIMGMETALQLTFNRNCDLHKPSYWPFLPLNLKFAN